MTAPDGAGRYPGDTFAYVESDGYFSTGPGGSARKSPPAGTGTPERAGANGGKQSAPAEGRMTHRYSVEVYYEDTDMGGIVYHPNYLKFCERARSDWVRKLGVDQNTMRAAGTVFAARRIEAEYMAPARFEDRLEVASRIETLTGARCVMIQEVSREGVLLFSARVEIVALRMAGGVARLPAEIKRALG